MLRLPFDAEAKAHRSVFGVTLEIVIILMVLQNDNTIVLQKAVAVDARKYVTRILLTLKGILLKQGIMTFFKYILSFSLNSEALLGTCFNIIRFRLLLAALVRLFVLELILLHL